MSGESAVTSLMTKPRTMPAGRRKKDIAVGQTGPALEEAVRKRRPSLRVLLLASSKGGSGKTTTAINLAVQATHAGLRVVTIDTDRQETLTKWAQLRPAEAPVIAHYTVPIGDHQRAMELIEGLSD